MFSWRSMILNLQQFPLNNPVGGSGQIQKLIFYKEKAKSRLTRFAGDTNFSHNSKFDSGDSLIIFLILQNYETQNRSVWTRKIA